MSLDQLEELKNVWKNQGESSIKFTESDIYKMVHKRSSSIVKWILIISILEFVLPYIFIFFTDFNSTKEVYQTYDLNNMMSIYTVIHIVVILGFIYFFFKNYKNIQADSSVKNLLHDILKTRKTVKYYIYYNLTMAAIIGLHVFYIVFNSDQFVNKLPANTNMLIIWSIAIAIFAFVLFLFWCFYRLIYGFLLKKLKKNYSELDRNE
ncbi:MAG: hypothetical protein OEM04_03545 [Flavobacteriaceae bacterium]|nr:hypothetical protein [Flavobacteriaceae bacterium]